MVIKAPIKKPAMICILQTVSEIGQKIECMLSRLRPRINFSQLSRSNLLISYSWRAKAFTTRTPDVQLQDGDEIDQKQQHNSAHANSLVGKEAPHGVHIRGRALNQFSSFGFRVVSEAQVLNVIVEIIAQ